MKNIIVIWKQLFQRMEEVDVFGIAAQLAYFFLLSLFPFLLFLLNLIAYLPINEQMIIDLIGYYAPDDIVNFINTNISRILYQQNGGLLSIGIIGTLWAASNAVHAIVKAFNKAYHIDENRSFIVTRLIAIVLTIAMIIVIIVSLLLPVFGRVLGEHIFAFFNLTSSFLAIWDTIRWGISTIIFFIVLLALYKLAPNMPMYIKDAVWGAVISTILWQAISYGFSYYINIIADYSVNYGSLGTVIVLMIWFYLLGIIIIIGGIINVMVRDYRLR
ncbi:YihY/virulence factor BrkB family protein [Oceanobacillus chungangensis]|uniref:Ribonuclease n=1 Tax=Oceanobacillus chungangensis TaxID=1229152 RepID=A0A3D8PQ90_9BACI|nr:YihY/virulence factor BrkB family protein [Oceanobacillus chungangensis]RDW17205.1 ribonuclease [Oceanobacillus chungangensis]